jgi:hypothetical protein
VSAVWLIVGGAAAFAATRTAVRATRGTRSQTARKRYSVLLTRADKAISLLEKHNNTLKALRRTKLPRLFRHEDAGVRKGLADAHRVENRVCLAFAELHEAKSESEIHMTTAQVGRFRRVLSRYRAAARKLRELERAARAKGLRFDKGRACRGDVPDPERLAEARGKRTSRRRDSQWRADQLRSRRERERAQYHHTSDYERRQLREQLEEGLRNYDDEDEWATDIAEDYDLLHEIYRIDPDLLAELADRYEVILDGARAVGLLDQTRSAF